jgi:hypothetical protein
MAKWSSHQIPLSLYCAPFSDTCKIHRWRPRLPGLIVGFHWASRVPALSTMSLAACRHFFYFFLKLKSWYSWDMCIASVSGYRSIGGVSYVDTWQSLTYRCSVVERHMNIVGVGFFFLWGIWFLDRSRSWMWVLLCFVICHYFFVPGRIDL